MILSIIHFPSITPYHQPNYLIVFDSLASLKVILATATTNPLVQRIRTILTTCLQHCLTVSVIWVPGNRGISGNEHVDQAGKLALKLPRVNSKSLSSSPPTLLITFASTLPNSGTRNSKIFTPITNLHGLKTFPPPGALPTWKHVGKVSPYPDSVLDTRASVSYTHLTLPTIYSV